MIHVEVCIDVSDIGATWSSLICVCCAYFRISSLSTSPLLIITINNNWFELAHGGLQWLCEIWFLDIFLYLIQVLFHFRCNVHFNAIKNTRWLWSIDVAAVAAHSSVHVRMVYAPFRSLSMPLFFGSDQFLIDWNWWLHLMINISSRNTLRVPNSRFIRIIPMSLKLL